MTDLIETVAREISTICHVSGGIDKLWPHFKQDANQILRAIEAAGYKIVPVEPTEEMTTAAITALKAPRMKVGSTKHQAVNDQHVAYRAMLATAPKVVP